MLLVLTYSSDFQLIGSRKNNEDLYDAAMNVLRELDVLREQNEKLVQNEHQNQEKMLLLNQADEALKREKVKENSIHVHIFVIYFSPYDRNNLL